MAGQNRKLLLVSYLFPPAGGIGVQRALGFAKYLPRHGFQVHVLTARHPAAPVLDPELLRHVPPEVTVHRCFTPEPPFYIRKRLWSLLSSRPADASGGHPPGPAARGRRTLLGEAVRRWLCPDPQVLWVPFALRRARQIIRRHGIETVLVTAPPFSVFLIGNALKDELPQLRLVSDFRDEWLRFYLTDFEFLSGEYTRRRAKQIERQTVELSDLVVAVTRASLREIRSRYPQQPDRKFAFIANGYDPDALDNFTPRSHPGQRMIVTHLGTLYKTASPKFYLDALDALPEEVRASVETRFIGRVADTEQPVLQSRKSLIRLLGFLPQAEALRLVEETDYLLLTMTNNFSLPGKLFEYLATGKFILALSPPGGEVAHILAETQAGWCADPADPGAVRDMLLRAYERFRSQPAAAAADRKKIRRYERPRLAEELARVMRDRLFSEGLREPG